MYEVDGLESHDMAADVEYSFLRESWVCAGWVGVDSEFEDGGSIDECGALAADAPPNDVIRTPAKARAFLFYQRLITWLLPRHTVASPWTSVFGSGHFEPTAGPE
jgi:hypothetical protein